MLTVAEIEGRSLASLSELLAVADVPGDLVTLDGDLAQVLDRCRYTDATFRPVENGYLGGIVLVLDEEVVLAPFGDAVQLVLAPAGALTVCRAELGLQVRPGGFAVSLSLLDVAVVLRVDGTILRPVPPGSLEPAETGVEIELGSATLRMATGRPVALEFAGSPAVPRCMIGDSGIVVTVGGIRWLTPGSEDLPAETPPDFTGLQLDDVTVELAALELPGDTVLRLDYAFLGHGGVTAAIAVEQLGLAGSLAGFDVELRSVGFTLVRNGLTACAIAGTLQIPFFDQAVDVALSLGGDGGVRVALAEAGAGALVALPLPGLGTFSLAGLGLSVGGGGASVVLSGRLEVTAGAPGLQWPVVAIQELAITADGRITLAGGWIVLQEPLALDLYGFGMEITRIGFGTEEDGRRWFGVDGAVRLTDLLPAGASARGLRVIWDPDRPSAPPVLSLDGIGVFFGVPDAFGFAGEVALTEDPVSGARLFTGALALGLDALDLGIDAGITIGRDAGTTYVFVHLGVQVPIPVAATGTALYGLEGLFAMNMAPQVAEGDWYGWYRNVPERFSATDPFKWSPDPGTWAFGAGLSLGTLPDAGFSVNAKALLVVMLPGPVILLQGTANILKVPAAFGNGAADEGSLGLLAAIDGRAGTLQLGIDAAWNVPRILDISASAEAFFDFDRLDAWHLWLGQDEPESKRIRADVLALFHADTWLMLGATGVSTGVAVSWGDSWRFGPVGLTLSAWIGARAALSTRPSQLEGGLDLGGEAAISVGPFGLGLSVGAGLEGTSFAPYRVAGTLAVSVGLPFPLDDLDVDIELEWSSPDTPQLEDPWTGALVEHERCTESWAPIQTGDTGDTPDADAPLVPLDARVLLTFAQPMGDDTPVADNPPAADPAAPIGDHEASYALSSLRLHRRRRSSPDAGWEDVSSTVVATWTPDAGEAGSRLQLFARSPFAFTRSTSRRWVDSFLDAHPTWPCTPAPPALRTCIDWSDSPREGDLPRIWEQEGATLSSEAPLGVYGSGDQRAVHLRWGTAPDGTPQPGLLWVALPEPAAEVTADVRVPEGDWVVLRGWSGDQQVAADWALPGAVTLRVAGTGIEAVTLGWGFNVEPVLVGICWRSQANAEAADQWSAGQELLEVAAARWSSEEPILEPDSAYLLEVTTRALLTRDGVEVDRIERAHAVQFQTGGPPGIVPDWVPEPDPAAPFPYGGVLADLTPYVRWSIPDRGALPVFRAYDLGCEFDADHVQQMYGADMRIRVRDHDGRPVLDAAGTELVFDNLWEEAPTTTLTTSEAAWLARLDACTGAIEWLGLGGDDQIRSQVPGLLYDDFSGTLETAWVAHVLDPGESRTANWHLDGGVLRQDVDLDGGTVYVATDVDAVDVAVETLAWANSGVYGLVFRWQGSSDHCRFSIGGQRLRLVRVQEGAERELWSAPGTYGPGVATRLAVQAQGARIRCQIDERLMCDVVEAGLDATAGSVGLYSSNSDSAAFDEVRARAWPGAALEPERPYTAELEASRPLFTDPLDNLDAFAQLVLSDGAAASIAGDPAAADYAVECSARNDGVGPFGLVARYQGPDDHLVLQLEPGGGRALVAHTGGSAKVLWADDGAVDARASYALALRVEAGSVTASIDGEEFTATTTLTHGRFGLMSAGEPGRAFSDLVVRSAPRTAVHSWSFTTSRFLGLPDMLDTFAGEVWPVDADGLDPAGLAGQATAGAMRLAAARAAVGTARAALAAAEAAGDAVELPGLRDAARRAVADANAESAAVHDLLADALGTSWRPSPPVVELSAVRVDDGVLALLLDLPEPLPWERAGWSLLAPGGQPLADLVLAWSGDGTRAILVRPAASPFAVGDWNLELTLHLDIGAERAVWRRMGSSAPEAGRLEFSLAGQHVLRSSVAAPPY